MDAGVGKMVIYIPPRLVHIHTLRTNADETIIKSQDATLVKGEEEMKRPFCIHIP